MSRTSKYFAAVAGITALSAAFPLTASKLTAEPTLAPPSKDLGRATGPIVHRVMAGGPDACRFFGTHPGCAGNFTLQAIERADGTVTGKYVDRAPGEEGFRAVVDCLVVVGNRAWISGTITRGNYTYIDDDGNEVVVDITGLPVVTSVQDNGSSADDPPDQISYSWLEQPVFGFAFPGPCTDMDDLDLLDAPEGQVLVE